MKKRILAALMVALAFGGWTWSGDDARAQLCGSSCDVGGGPWLTCDTEHEGWVAPGFDGRKYLCVTRNDVLAWFPVNGRLRTRATSESSTPANDPRINKLSSIFAMRPSRIECRSAEEDSTLTWAWGYTYLSWDYAVVDSGLCRALVNLLDGKPYDDWEAAEAVATVVHESYHVRRWGGRASEAQVECKAIRHFKVAMRLLGVQESVITRLWPFAAWDHYRLTTMAPEYNLKGCQIKAPWES